MKNKVIILTEDDLSLKGQRVPTGSTVRLYDFSHMNLTMDMRNKSDLIIFIQEGFPIKVLKDRTGKFNAPDEVRNSEKNALLDQGIKLKSICRKQSSYLFSLLHDNKHIDLDDENLKMIIYVLVRTWYNTKLSNPLNELRKKYVSIVTLGTLI